MQYINHIVICSATCHSKRTSCLSFNNGQKDYSFKGFTHFTTQYTLHKTLRTSLRLLYDYEFNKETTDNKPTRLAVVKRVSIRIQLHVETKMQYSQHCCYICIVQGLVQTSFEMDPWTHTGSQMDHSLTSSTYSSDTR